MRNSPSTSKRSRSPLWLLGGGIVFGVYFGLGLMYFETFDFGEEATVWERIPVFAVLILACVGLVFAFVNRVRKQSLNLRSLMTVGLPLLVFSVAALLLAVYAAQVTDEAFSFALFSRIGFNLLLVGLLPVVAALVYLQGNQRTEESVPLDDLQDKLDERQLFALQTGPGGEGFEVFMDELVLVEAADNYCKFHCTINGNRKVKTFRIALKEVEKRLEAEDYFHRCHRSFLVNANMIEDIQGVSQAYKLKLRTVDELVPVSRSFDIGNLSFLAE